MVLSAQLQGKGDVFVTVTQPCEMSPCDRDGKHSDKGEAQLGSSEAGDPSAAEQIFPRPTAGTETPGGARVNTGTASNTQGHTMI